MLHKWNNFIKFYFILYLVPILLINKAFVFYDQVEYLYLFTSNCT